MFHGWFVRGECDSVKLSLHYSNSLESVAVLKLNICFIIIHDKPLKLALIYTACIAVTQSVDECIEAWFSRVWLITTVVDFNVVCAYNCNQITMQMYMACVGLVVVRNCCVVFTQWLFLCDRVAHLLFDESHWLFRLVPWYYTHTAHHWRSTDGQVVNWHKIATQMFWRQSLSVLQTNHDHDSYRKALSPARATRSLPARHGNTLFPRGQPL